MPPVTYTVLNYSGWAVATVRTDKPIRVEDLGSGIQDVTFPALFGMSQVVVDNAAPYEHTYTVDPAWAGVGSYTIVVRDHLGHATEVPVNIVSDFTPPTIAAVNLPDNPSLQFDVAWDAADGDSGVQSYEVQYTCTGCMQPGMLPVVTAPKHSASFTGQSGASYTFSVRARDRVGNVSQWVSADPVTVQTETKYYLFGGRRVAMKQGSAVYYFHTNHLGSVVLTTDAAGAAVSQTRYLPFGEEHWSSGGSLSDFMYTGQRKTDFGLLDYNARFYSSRLGRFASADSIIPGAGNPIAWDRYAGTGNNPIRFKDPSGHAQACADGDLGGGCGSAGVYIPKPPTPTSTYRPFTTNTPNPSQTPSLLIPYVPENQRTYVPKLHAGPTQTPTSPPVTIEEVAETVADVFDPLSPDPFMAYVIPQTDYLILGAGLLACGLFTVGICITVAAIGASIIMAEILLQGYSISYKHVPQWIESARESLSITQTPTPIGSRTPDPRQPEISPVPVPYQGKYEQNRVKSI